ncbi:MAG TPA: CheR family methyltransferase [Kofleriaceae bacterium]|nr:CheR family methyltransferase [Kofleriaceae bacterium]
MSPTEGELARFAAAVAARLGLRLEPERAAELIERRAEARRDAIPQYLDRLDTAEPAELRALTTELTVGETYFLRHCEQFRAFIDVAVPDRLADGRLRVLSAGCSSGEEPYTLAMLLHGAYPDRTFEVHAVDLNPESIARARNGRYSPWSLRAMTPELERRWFVREGREVVVVPELRARVTFEPANLIEDAVLGTRDRWDVVFCRNVIMYFTEDRADAVLSRFARAIVPGGYLFLGHAETLRDRTDDFDLCHTHGAFYYRRRATAARSGHGARITPEELPLPSAIALAANWYGDIQAATQRVHAMIDGALDRGPGAAAATPGSSRASPPDLTAIRELLAQERFGEALEQLDQLDAVAADRDIATLRALVLTHAGRFADARVACRELLAIDPISAGANYLLALCCDSTGDTRGAAHLAEVAAQLDPSFAMPRVHLGLLARRTGARELASRELTLAIALLEREAPARLELYGGGFSRQALLGMCRAELAAIGGQR